MIKAVDYTSGGDNDDIEVMIGGTKKAKVKKKFIEDVVELNEYGVYNSETDTKSNVKTGENEISDSQAFIDGLCDSVKHVIASLTEMKKTVEENSKLSFDSLDICVAELTTYCTSLEDEAANIGSANT